MKKYKRKFFGQADINFCLSSKFKKVVDSGLIGVAIGIESLNPKFLKQQNKLKGSLSVEKIKKAIRRLRENKVFTFGFFIIDPD